MKVMVFDVGGTEIKYSVMDETLSRWDEGAIPWSSDRAALDALGEEVLTGMEDLSGRQAQKLGEIYAQALE